MEKSEVSIHELKVYLALRKDENQWLTNAEIARLIEGSISQRTVRAHTAKLVRAGLVDQAEVFPGHRFRWATRTGKQSGGYLQRLEKAREVFGL
jgi:DNA-binding transcriptional ArsR family regulator